MIKTSRTSRIILCGLLILLCVSLVVSATEVKWAHHEPLNSAVDKATKILKERVEKETNGEMEILLFPAGQLGNANDLAEMVSMGNFEGIVSGSTGNISNAVPAMQVYDIPFILPESLWDALEVMNSEPVLDSYSNSLAKANIKVLAFYIGGNKQFTSNFPIRKPEDMVGHKYRVMASPLLIETYKVWGASPIPISFQELYTALQLGTVEGQENSVRTIYQMKFHEVQDYLTISNHAPFTQVVYANLDWFNSLPEEYQRILLDAIQDSALYVLEESIRQGEEFLKIMPEESDIVITTLTEEERQAFMVGLEQVKQKYFELTGEEGRAILKAIEEESSKY